MVFGSAKALLSFMDSVTTYILHATFNEIHSHAINFQQICINSELSSYLVMNWYHSRNDVRRLYREIIFCGQ